MESNYCSRCKKRVKTSDKEIHWATYDNKLFHWNCFLLFIKEMASEGTDSTEHDWEDM